MVCATAQCIVNEKKLVRGIVPVRKLEPTPDFTPELIRVCSGVVVGAELILTGRGLFNARVIRCRSENKIQLIPRKNTDAAVEALRQYARRGRPCVSRREVQKAQAILPPDTSPG